MQFKHNSDTITIKLIIKCSPRSFLIIDNGKLGEIIGASVANGTKPTAELVASVLTDSEILDEVRSRNLELSPVIGGVATESVANDALEVSETLPIPVTPESLLERVDTAHKGYTDFVTQLNIRREEKGKDTILRGTSEKLAEELEVWATPEKIEYINKVLETDPTLTYTVTATLNDLVSGQEVIDSGRQFGDSQPHATNVWSDILTKYADEEVSEATVRSNNTYTLSVRFSKSTLNTGDRDNQNRAITTTGYYRLT